MRNIFLGCVKEVFINNKVLDLLQAANVAHKVSPGCGQYQDQGDDEQLQDATNELCLNGRHKCRNGAKSLPKQPTSIANLTYGNQLNHHLLIFMNAAVLSILNEGFVKIDVRESFCRP